MLLFMCLTSRVLPGTLISIFFLIFSDSHDRHKGGTALCLLFYCYHHFVCLALLHIAPYIPYVGPSCAIERRFIFIYSFEIIVYDGLQLLRFAFFYKLSYLSSKLCRCATSKIITKAF